MIHRWLGSTLAGALLLAAATTAPAQGAPLTIDHAAPNGVAIRFQRPGSAHAQLVGGTLSAPSSAAPVAIASAYLATRPEILGGVEPATLRLLETRDLGGTGASVRYAQTFHGVDVLGGDVFVRVDTQGRVRWAKSATRSIPAGFDVTPGLDPSAAIARAEPDRAQGPRRPDHELPRQAGVQLGQSRRHDALGAHLHRGAEPHHGGWRQLPVDPAPDPRHRRRRRLLRGADVLPREPDLR